MSGQRIVPILDANRDVYIHGSALQRQKLNTDNGRNTAAPPSSSPLSSPLTAAATKEYLLTANATIKILQPAPKEPSGANSSKTTAQNLSSKSTAKRVGTVLEDQDDAETHVLHRPPPAAAPPLPRPTLAWRQLHAYIGDISTFATLTQSAAVKDEGYGFSMLFFSPTKTVTPATSAFSKSGVVFAPSVSLLFTSRNKILDSERTAASLCRRQQCKIFPLFQIDTANGMVLPVTTSARQIVSPNAATWSAIDMTSPCIRHRDYACHTAYEQEEWTFLYHSVLTQYWQCRLETGSSATSQKGAAASAVAQGASDVSGAVPAALIKGPSVFQFASFALDITDVPDRFFLPSFANTTASSIEQLHQYLTDERRKPFRIVQFILSTEHLFTVPRHDANLLEKENISATNCVVLTKGGLEFVTVLAARGVVEIKGRWGSALDSDSSSSSSASKTIRLGFFSPKAASEAVLELQRVYVRIQGTSCTFPSETINL